MIPAVEKPLKEPQNLYNNERGIPFMSSFLRGFAVLTLAVLALRQTSKL